ncbi:MAG: CarD family transcriptional regulator [Pelolinea sp.]|nr:CarD family transcriptional regulator [Pelolinea sp.]
MPKITLELAEGDWIVHSRHGLGQITGMDKKELFGDRKVFYIVKTELITYWLSLSEVDSGRIRPVETTEVFSKALEIIGSEPKTLDNNFRRRLMHIQNLVEDATLLSKAALIRDLHARDVQKDMHVNEKKILENLERQFVNEWVQSCHIPQEEARAQMRDALNRSSVNLVHKKPAF